MGFDVMSRRVRVNGSMSSSPSPSSHTKSLERDKYMSDAFLNKSLTPHRKHHKLLKDGSEVWSEDVEKIFVEGLREYWESPWATYSRGRSRWRNQFLVEHLRKAGIVRSKKQVASHIQVLRNMWRGEPEFHLVAGGEELFAENGLLASPDNHSGSEPLPTADNAALLPSTSSSASTPDYSMSDFSASLPHHVAFSKGHSPVTSMGAIDASTEFAGASVSTRVALGTPPSSPPPQQIQRAPVKLEPLHVGLFSFPPLPPSPMSGFLGSASASPIFSSTHPTNRLLQLNLWAEGMTMVTFDVDQLSAAMAMPPLSPQDLPPSILFRIKISITSIGDIHSSPNLHGLHGAIMLASRWTSSAKCVTKLYSGTTCISQESAFLEQLPPSNTLNPSLVACALPESSLSRCKWLLQEEDKITQQIVVDGIIVAAFVYTLERTVIPGSGPTAELLGFQKYKMPTRSRTVSQPFSPPVTPDGAQPSAVFYPAAAYHNPMMQHSPISTQLSPQDVIDPSVMHVHAYPTSGVASSMHSQPTGGSLYHHP
ncbi:hypothetical protein BC835DRAFT_919335 [Cytidiella melzeri]|nr:hypothetical protein BC835DRAFT_919335 [Cytidiella melzeri]